MTQPVDAVNQPRGHIRYGWPLQTGSWRRLPEVISNNPAWQSRPLSHASKGSIPATTGVYMMCVCPPMMHQMRNPFASLINVIYVGQSKNLRTRYQNHLNTPSAKVRAARSTYADSLRFWFLQLPANEIRVAESILIDCFGPPANDKPGDKIPVVMGSPQGL